MNLYVVEWEEDGKTVKAPGVAETEIKQCNRYFAAENWETVWEAVEYIRSDPERRLKRVGEVLESVTVIPAVGKDGSRG